MKQGSKETGKKGIKGFKARNLYQIIRFVDLRAWNWWELSLRESRMKSFIMNITVNICF